MICLDKIFRELKKDFNLKVFLDSYEFKIAKSERSELFFDKENRAKASPQKTMLQK